jgi:DNA-binding transcriptional LysR family regulator
MFDTRRLEALIAVADRGSVSAAARELSLTQPAVSHHLARLEEQAGVKLLAREPRGMRTTAAGDLLVARARTALAELQLARRELDDLLELTSGQVEVRAFPTAFADLLPEAIERLRAEHPAVDVSFAPASRTAALDAVARREADVAVVFAPASARPAALAPGLHATHLLDDELLAVLPRSHRLASHERISLRDLADEPWVLGGGELIRAALGAAGITPHVVIETDDLLAAHGVVAAGLAVTLSPALAVAHTRLDIVLRPLEERVARRIEAVAHAAACPAAHALVAMLRDVATGMI